MTDTEVAKPLPESYWVVPGQFLAGQYPLVALGNDIRNDSMLAAFLEAGFDVFIDLTRPGELPPYLPALEQQARRYNGTVQHQRFVIQDRGLPTRPEMETLLDAVDAALAAGRKVYLHCWGGIGRTGMAVGCWLVRHGLTGEMALVRLNILYQDSEQSHIYPRTPETEAQARFILEYQEGKRKVT
jgi:Cyclin-dependent kinase inhibitor 3 (CDKN3)